MVRKIKGFSLIELLVVIVIMAILLGIGIPMILGWIKKTKIREDTEKIYSLIQYGRQKAFTEKINMEVSLGDKEICLKNSENGLNVKCVSLNHTWQTNKTITVSKRGILSNGTVYYSYENSSPYDCVKTSITSIKMDKCNGNP